MAGQQLNIPGYFYDKEKKRYFKVEASSTAPPGASWSRDKVKQRRVETKQAEVVNYYRRRKEALTIKRSALHDDPLTGGLLLRETGIGGDPRELPARALALGLRNQGFLEHSESRLGPAPGISNNPINTLYIDQADTLYTGAEGPTIAMQAFGEDDRGCIAEAGMLDPDSAVHYPVSLPRDSSCEVAATAFDETRNLLITVLHKTWSCPMLELSPITMSLSGRRRYLQGTLAMPIQVPHERYWDHTVYSCVVAPKEAQPAYLAAIATGGGVVVARDWNESAQSIQFDRLTADCEHPLARDVFSVDFCPGNPWTLLAGGRRGGVWLGDLRQGRHTAWVHAVATAGPVAHVKPVDEHKLLAAGPSDFLALYDVRYCAKDPGAARRGADKTWPVVRFPQYRNAAHVTGLGLDIAPADGLVAAASDGTAAGPPVALFSLHSGRRLRCPALDALTAPPRRPVAALRFARTRRDRDRNAPAALYVALGSAVHKFAFGAGSTEPDEDY